MLATQRQHFATLTGFCHNTKVICLVNKVFYGKANNIVIVNYNDFGRIDRGFNSLASCFFMSILYYNILSIDPAIQLTCSINKKNRE